MGCNASLDGLYASLRESECTQSQSLSLVQTLMYRGLLRAMANLSQSELPSRFMGGRPRGCDGHMICQLTILKP